MVAVGKTGLAVDITALAKVHISSFVFVGSFRKGTGACAAANDTIDATEAVSARFFGVAVFAIIGTIGISVFSPAILAFAAMAVASRVFITVATGTVAICAQRIGVAFCARGSGTALVNSAVSIA